MWALNLVAVEYGTTVITTTGAAYALIDTSTAFLLLAQSDYDLFTAQI